MAFYSYLNAPILVNYIKQVFYKGTYRSHVFPRTVILVKIYVAE